ncbi:MAG: hypothetical protein R3A45_08770 [Bdellovibrionota bacterium]
MPIENEGIIKKIKFEDQHPIIGPLTREEKEIILLARKWVLENTLLKMVTPNFINKNGSEFLYHPWPRDMDELDQHSHVFFRHFEPYFQSLAVKNWYKKNEKFLKKTNEYAELLQKLTEDTGIPSLLGLFDIREKFWDFSEKLNKLKNVLRSKDEIERKKGGRPIEVEKILFPKLIKHPFIKNPWPVEKVFLTKKEIVYIMVAMGLWLPYTEDDCDLEMTLHTFAENKKETVEKQLDRENEDLIFLERLLFRDER